MKITQSIIIFLLGAVFGVFSCLITLNVTPMNQATSYFYGFFINALSCRSENIIKEIREYPELILEDKDGRAYWSTYFMGKKECTNREETIQFLTKHEKLITRMSADKERMVFLHIDPKLNYQLFSDSVQVIKEAKYNYIWLTDIGLLKVDIGQNGVAP